MKKYSNFLISIIIFLIPFIIYLLTTAPDLTFTDSGELAGACVTLGIAHPTGYPLFTLLGHLWTYLPIASKEIYELNIFASFLTALSCVFFYQIILLLLNFVNESITQKKKKSTKQIELNKSGRIQHKEQIMMISISSTLLYAFSQTIWQQAIAIEVYSLHLLLINATLFLFFRGVFHQSRKYFILSAFFLGLSLTNHMTTILIIPMMVFLYFLTPYKKKPEEPVNSLKFLFFLAVPFLLGLSLYLYLPIRASAMPEFNWGWVSRSFEKFWYHLSGKQYQVWMFSGTEIIKQNLVRFFESIPNQIAWIGLIPFLIGCYYLFKKSIVLFGANCILIISCLLYAVNYSIHDIESYFVAAYIGIFIFTAYGILKLSKNISSMHYISFFIPLISIGLNYEYNDRSDDYLVPEYTNILFQKLEPNAIILSSQWDFWVSAAWYKQRVEGFRKDVVIIDKELLRRTWYLEQLRRWYPEQIELCKKEIEDYLIDLELFESGEEYNPTSIQRKFIALQKAFIDKNINTSPVYLTLDVLESEPEISKGYTKVSDGLAFRLIQKDEPVNITLNDVDINKFAKSVKSNQGYLVDAIKSSVAISFVNVGRYLLMKHKRDEALIAFQKAYKIDPENKFVLQGIKNIDNFQFVE
jgi:tetratricopeptide (TPR) repeat protein